MKNAGLLAAAIAMTGCTDEPFVQCQGRPDKLQHLSEENFQRAIENAIKNDKRSLSVPLQIPCKLEVEETIIVREPLNIDMGAVNIVTKTDGIPAFKFENGGGIKGGLYLGGDPVFEVDNGDLKIQNMVIEASGKGVLVGESGSVELDNVGMSGGIDVKGTDATIDVRGSILETVDSAAIKLDQDGIHVGLTNTHIVTHAQPTIEIGGDRAKVEMNYVTTVTSNQDSIKDTRSSGFIWDINQSVVVNGTGRVDTTAQNTIIVNSGDVLDGWLSGDTIRGVTIYRPEEGGREAANENCNLRSDAIDQARNGLCTPGAIQE